MLTARCRPVPQQIYPDPELEVQVLSLAIRCIHSEEGCRWSGLIKHLQVGAGGQGEERGLHLGGALGPPPPSDRPCAPRSTSAPAPSTSSPAPTAAAPS